MVEKECRSPEILANKKKGHRFKGSEYIGERKFKMEAQVKEKDNYIP